MNKEEIIQGVEDYERAFHKFVDAHKTYLSFEDDEGMIDVANESYDKENVGIKGKTWYERNVKISPQIASVEQD